MVKRIAILLITTTIGTSVQAQDCFYEQKSKYEDGTIVNSITKYDCKTPPEVIYVERDEPEAFEKEPKFDTPSFFFGATAKKDLDSVLTGLLSVVVSAGGL